MGGAHVSSQWKDQFQDFLDSRIVSAGREIIPLLPTLLKDRRRVREAAQQLRTLLDQYNHDERHEIATQILDQLNAMDETRLWLEGFLGYRLGLPPGGSEYLQEEPFAPAPEIVVDKTRYVNTIVAPMVGQFLAAGETLELNKQYELLISIGDYRFRSLLAQTEASFPRRHLPDPTEGLWLYAVVWGHGINVRSKPQPFYLPPEGDSFVCTCSPGSPEHTCAARDRAPFVRSLLDTPQEPRVARLEVSIYYRVALIHAQQITLPVGVAQIGLSSVVIWSITQSFTSLGDIAHRDLSVQLGSDNIVVNGASFAAIPFRLEASQWSNAAGRVQAVLFGRHLEFAKGKWKSCYDNSYTKPKSQYVEDLRALAQAGAQLYRAIFVGKSGRYLAPTLKHETKALNRPARIQVAKTVPSTLVIPWQVLYELPVTGHPSSYNVCPSVFEFGPDRPADTDVPHRCPNEERHQKPVLCPFGFWGFAYVLECPPPLSERDLDTVVSRIEVPFSFIAAADPGLDASLTNRHLARLKMLLPELKAPPMQRMVDLMEGLRGSDIDIVYIYAHAGRLEAPGGGAPDPLIRLGADGLLPYDVTTWAQDDWPMNHWEDRRPLVVLNGCHTAEITPGTLSNFVTAFSESAGASGVIGTEVSLEQGLAAEAMEFLLPALRSGSSVGDALRLLRWELLRKGNVMGLAYSPYCSSALRLREHVPNSLTA